MCESIKVAVRIRPLVESEISRGCQSCLDVSLNENQVIVRNEKGYTYNYVFDQSSNQDQVYEVAVKSLVQKLFEGFNVTILAYGQTGSGKTHTMGTCYTGEGEMGVIPRAVEDIFKHLKESVDWEYQINVSFMELYKEQLYDLLAADRSVVEIREDTKGICIPGLTETPVKSVADAMNCLQQGSAGRVTGSTAMNVHSSRSHAIFTLMIHQQKRNDTNSATTAKFHLVDLAGSERSKKTQAVGDRFKEGVNINYGLLALGNVISALGEGSKQVPSYRNSKLTRLLQDSLGGNSMTLMIACVSPADYNLDETLSTLRYADRARRIKNKPIINRDPKSAEINELKQKVNQLQLELLNRVGGGTCDPSHGLLEEETKKLNAKLRMLTQKYNDALSDNALICERVVLAEAARDRMKERVTDLEAEMEAQLRQFEKVVEEVGCPEDVKNRLRVLEKSWTAMLGMLREEQKRSETEMWDHVSNEADDQEAGSSAEDICVDGHADSEFDQKQEQLAAKQAELNKEFRELTRQLALKEEFCEKYSKNTLLFDENFKQSAKLYEQYEKQIAELIKEKEELVNNINKLKSANKEADLKAKQTELVKKNAEIENLQKKLHEQGKIVKQKEAAEKKVALLNSEIVQMKQAKVKLIRQMKSEGEKFRMWRIEREREATKLRDQDRKRQNEMARMQSLHCKQQNVFKRKLEEAAACNKRLKEALMKQKSVQEKRQLLRGSKEQVQEFVAHELEVLMSTVDAQRTLQQLLEDRAALNAQFKELKSIVEDEGASSEYKEEAEKEIAQTKQELELRNAQIADLQQKILDSDQENKANTRWDAVQSMADAKMALKHAFELAAEVRRDAATQEILLKEAQSDVVSLQDKVNKLERELKRTEEKHKKELLKLEKEHQEELHCFLSAENRENVPDCSHFDKTMTAGQLRLLQATEQKLMRKKEECAALENWISLVSTEGKFSPMPKKKPKQSRPREFEDLEISADGSFVDDTERDPDWKNTPIHKRLTALKSKIQWPVESRKRGSDGSLRCGCQSSCNTKRCMCVKMESSCGESCSCDSSKCKFKIAAASSSGLNETYVKSNESDDVKKPRYTYKLEF